MAYDNETLRLIYRRTDGYCHICGRKLAITNYNCLGSKGAWEVEHSVPRAKGGTDRLNNLYPAHITCNREKLTVTTRTARGWHGRTRAPMSREKKKDARETNTVIGALSCGLLGLRFGPVGGLIGLAVGAAIGSSVQSGK